MVVYRRNVLTNKDYEAVCQIIQSSAYYDSCRIENNTFSIMRARRGTKGQLVFTPVTGTLIDCDGGTRVTLELGAGVVFLVGIAVFLLGLIAVLAKLLFPAFGSWAGSIPTVGVGALIAVFSWLRGMEIIDLLEHKLTREI